MPTHDQLSALRREEEGRKQGPSSVSSQGTVTFVVEDDPDYVSPFSNSFGKDTTGHALYSALVTLALGVLGSTVLPVPYAFSKTGIAAGVATMALVALANDLTCCMLVRAAAHTGHTSYEELAAWAGGRRAKIVTQVSLLLLLFGTLCGGLAFLSDVARIMVLKGVGSSAPQLLQQDGRPIMVATVLMVLLPLCLQRHIRQFEKAATVGVVVVLVLCVLIISKAVALGFPAVASGELDVVGLKLDGHLPEAFAVLGFAFYMQPMLMPLVKEMPGGAAGVALTEKAVHITLFGVACGVYGTVGIFGASIFGASTESNIMVNDLMPGQRHATLALYAALLGYLCCGMVTTHYALRASLDLLLVGPDAPFTWRRQVAETLGVLTCAVCVALTFPTQAEKIFALTGCTAVCLVCYCIPAYIHIAVVASQRADEAAGSGRRSRYPPLPPGMVTIYSPPRAGAEASHALPPGAHAKAAGGAAGPQGQDAAPAGPDTPPGAHSAPRAGSSAERRASLEERGVAGNGAGGPGGELSEPLLGGSSHSQQRRSEDAGAGLGAPGRAQRPPHRLSGGSGGGSMASKAPPSRSRNAVVRALRDYGAAVLVVSVGVGFSCAGLWVAVLDLITYLHAREGQAAGGPQEGGQQVALGMALAGL